ncbi:hypothetical protein VE03_03937 [Pseudogymnoascus sp. 23342-1-I1]|nr:hypothetical protein VE03_03937 [Pseudogymnoascus sp. 23342-1-I1]
MPHIVSLYETTDSDATEPTIYQPASSIAHYERIPPIISPPSTLIIEGQAVVGLNLEQTDRGGFHDGRRRLGSGTFMAEVNKMVNRKLHEPTQTYSQPSAPKRNGHPLLFPVREGRQHEVDYTLPLRKQADSLMDAYWRYLHVLHPYLDKAQTQDDYRRLWMGYDSINDERSFLCLLNIIFAVSCRLIGLAASEDRDRSAATFYLRSQKLMDIVEVASVRSVQIYLLLAQYFQSTSQYHQCWVFVGLATRTAQTLELHLPSTSERISDTSTRELLRRTITISARTVSGVPLPLAIDEENRYVLQNVPEGQQNHIIDFYISILRLYEILQNVTFIFDSTKLQNRSVDGSHNMHAAHLSSTEGHYSVYQVEQRLSHWEKGLPDHQKIENYAHDEETHSVLYHQAVVLHQRHLHIHLLLLRPVLADFVISELRDTEKSTSFGSLLTYRASLQCAIVCVKISQEVIDIIFRDDDASASKLGSLSPWWDNALYVYTAAMIIIAARLSTSVLAEIPAKSLSGHLRKAVEILERYSLFSASIPRLIGTLRLLMEVVPRQYARVYPQLYQDDASTTAESPRTSISGATFSFWCPIKPKNSSSHPSDLTSRHSTPENEEPGLDAVFDPEDFAWLMTTPLNS